MSIPLILTIVNALCVAYQSAYMFWGRDAWPDSYLTKLINANLPLEAVMFKLAKRTKLYETIFWVAAGLCTLSLLTNLLFF